MKKHLLKSFAVMVMACGPYAWAYADNTVYGLIDFDGSSQTVSFDLDGLSTSAKTTLSKGFEFENFSGIKGGVTAGDKYYAFGTVTDEDGNSSRGLVTLNFTNGKMTVVNNFSYEYGKAGYYTTGLAYDDKNGKLYAIEKMYEDAGYVTKLYEVSEKTGAYTKVGEYEGEYQAIAADHQGGFYLMKYTSKGMNQCPNLYKISSDYTLSEYFTNSEVGAFWPSSSSLAVSPDGKVAYAFEGSTVVTIDLEAKTATVAGSLSADGTAATNVYAISYGKGTADGVHNNPPVKKKEQTRFLVKTEQFGDFQGFIPKDVVSVRNYYYYNTNGDQVGYVRYGRNANNREYFDTFEATNIQKSVFDDDENLIAKNEYQWGKYDKDLYCWKQSKSGSVNYTYDVKGNMATKETSYQLIEYTYNEDNTLAKEDTYLKNKVTGNQLLQSVSYSGYDKSGNPTHAVSTGTYDNYNYGVDFEYDADGNELSEYRYQTVDGAQKPLLLKTWKYENGILSEYVESNFDANGNEQPNIKDVYTPVDGNPNLIKYENFCNVSGTWQDNGSKIYQYYADFSGKKDGSKVSLTVVKDEELKNTADLIFDIPQLASFNPCKIVIYRDCQAIDTVAISDVINMEIDKCVYQDKEVKNGTYSYFVQPLFAVNNGGIPLSDDPFGDEGTTEEQEYEGYYSSSAVEVTFDIDLPVVTDLKLATGRKTGGSIFEAAKYYAGLTWKNPSDMADYGFEKNTIYFTDKWNRLFADDADITDASAESIEVEMDDDMQIQVATFYKYGRVFSDPISVTLKDIENGGTAGIETIDGGKATIAFNGKNISLSDNANVTVFSANGQQVYSGKNVSAVSLDSMPDGAYIICVEKDGKVNAYKYNAK